MLLVLCLLLAVMCAMPLTIRVQGAHLEETRLSILLRWFSLTRRWQLVQTESGKRLARVDADGRVQLHPPDPQRRRQLGTALSTLARADRARRFLLTHLRLQTLDALVCLHTDSAAHAALLSGGLDALARLPRLYRQRIRLRVLPDFFRGHSIWQARCIIRPRLGTLIITALMLLAAYAAGQIQLSKEAESWNIPSEN